MFDYIIVQAGGRGTRMKELTKNKPKGLVPVDNLPIIFHLFKKYPEKKFIIIGDYKQQVMDEYLEIFCDRQFLTVKAEGSGTCAGLRKALATLPEEECFMLIWSDLILGKNIEPELESKQNYVGISRDFMCRWSYQAGSFKEVPSKEFGVAGVFIFKNKRQLEQVPSEGEFVRWLQKENLDFSEVKLEGTKEIGTILTYEENLNKKYRCRPFNKIEVKDNQIIKSFVDAQGEMLAKREIAWYREVKKYCFKQIPKIYSYEPLVMEKIDEAEIFDKIWDYDTRKLILEQMISSLKQLHELKKKKADVFSIMEVYYFKTYRRINQIRDLIPFSQQKRITINNKPCKNPFFYKRQLKEKIGQFSNSVKEFSLIHGDCTFSNILVRKYEDIVVIDPRGYFGHSELYGDIDYDWAKLYYSVVGNYDQFNNKKFDLEILDSKVNLKISSNGWEDLEDYFFSALPDINIEKLKILHGIIWLSLATYAWEDYDSICAAFYQGTYLLDEWIGDYNDEIF